MRWGGGGQKDTTDLRGYELRVGYGIRQDTKLVFRYFDAASPTTEQDGKRARLDLSYRF